MASRIKWTYEDIKSIVNKDGYELISTINEIEDKYKYTAKGKLFIKKKAIIYIKCAICGEVYNVTFDAFYNGTRHYDCARKIASMNNRYTIKDISNQLAQEGYSFVDSSQYKTKDSMCTLKCPRGHIWDTTLHNFDHYKCPYCKEEDRLVDNYNKLINFLHSINYIFISYKHSEDNTCFTNGYVTYCCNNNHITTQSVNGLYSGKRCGKCSTTKGENMISKILQQYNISFEFQHKFKDCIDKDCLPFDFYIPSLNITIEYDGVGHFKPIDFAGKGKKWAEENFKTIQRHDNIKTQYCINKGIKLIRIPYIKFDNIEEILIKELNL